jgi:hypothetical protein
VTGTDRCQHRQREPYGHQSGDGICSAHATSVVAPDPRRNKSRRRVPGDAALVR